MDEDFEFQVGETYANRRQQYTVRAIDGDTLVVVFDDGTEGTLDVAIQTRIVENMRLELARLTGGQSTSDSQARFMRSVGFLAAAANLQAELPPKSVDAFLRTYRDLTGIPAVPGTPGLFLLSGTDDKWGPELRIYFEANPAQLDRLYFGEFIEVRDGTQAGVHRINNNSLFLRLLQMGFVLGPGQELGRIRARVPAAVRDVFEEGTNL